MIIGAASLFACADGAAAAAAPLADPGVTVESVGTLRATTESPADSDLARALDQARARIHPGTGSAALRTPGIKAYGSGPYVPEGPEEECRHGNDERVSVENVLRGARIFEEIVRDVAR